VSWKSALIGTALLSGGYVSGFGADAPRIADPIRLPLTFVHSNPVTTITVGGRSVQAIVDISGGDADGALTLSKELIEAAHIGKHFLSRYLVVVDYAGASITLWPPDTTNPAGANCGRIRIPMEHTKEARLAVSTFDTTAGRVRLLWGANAYSMLPLSLVDKLGLATATHGSDSPRFHHARTLSAAGQDPGPLEFVVLPLEIPTDFEGMLGGNFFDHHVVCLDYRRREIRVR
jgi:hypothetical protein